MAAALEDAWPDVALQGTVVTRYGHQQEGAEIGYNPRRRGKPSHHPLLAFAGVLFATGGVFKIQTWMAFNKSVGALGMMNSMLVDRFCPEGPSPLLR